MTMDTQVEPKVGEPYEGPPPVLDLAVVALVVGACLWHLQFRTANIIGTDSYFHMKMALLMRRTGEAVLRFPWTQFSIFKDHFSDSSFLYHLLLVPFTLVTDEVWASKVAAVVLGTLFFVVFYHHLRALEVPYPVFFLVLLMSAGSLFVYRITMNRDYLVSMSLAVLELGFLSRKNPLGFFIVALIYPLSYTAFQVSIVLAVLAMIADGLSGQWPDHWPLMLAVVGSLLGLLVHPSFPEDLVMWWVQNVRVLTLKWSGVELFFGGELYPPEVATLLFSTSSIAASLLVAVTLILVVPVRHSRDTLLHFIALVFFGLMTLLSKRFVEYSAPLGVAFLGLVVRDTLRAPGTGLMLARWPRTAMAAGWMAIFVQAALLAHGYLDVRRDVAGESKPGLKDGALWLAAHTKPGTIVYTLDWDEFPQVFYYNDKDYFLVCLDPCFFYAYDPQLFNLWHKVSNVNVPDIYNPIVKQFHAHWVLAKNRFTQFQVKAASDPRFTRTYYDKDCTIFRLSPDLDFVATWALDGPYPIGKPLPIDGDQEALLTVKGTPLPYSTPVLNCPWRRFDTDTLGSYVDLERSLGSVEDCFAYAWCTLQSPIDQDVTLRVGFDDGLTVWLNGTKLFDNPGPHEVKIDEHSIKAHLQRGPNALLVRCINYKANWGFYLRVTEAIRPVAPIQPLPSAPLASPAIVIPRTVRPGSPALVPMGAVGPTLSAPVPAGRRGAGSAKVARP